MISRPTAKQIAAEAIASGALRVGGEPLPTHTISSLVNFPIAATAITCHNLQIHSVKLPDEVGLQVPHPAPKADGRTKAVLRNKPRKAGNRKYVVTPAQLRAERPHLYL